MPGRLVNLAGTITLCGPKKWPWAQCSPSASAGSARSSPSTGCSQRRGRRPTEEISADNPGPSIEEGLVLAWASANDGWQRSIGLEVGGREAQHQLRPELR